MITREQIGIIAVLTQTNRTNWDTRAIIPVIEKLRHRDLAEVTWAAIRAAQDPSIRTPGGIALDGDHWRPIEREGLTPAERDAARAQRRADAEARWQAIDHCDHCDPYGYLPSGNLCLHVDPELLAARAQRGAERARAALAAHTSTPEDAA